MYHDRQPTYCRRKYLSNSYFPARPGRRKMLMIRGCTPGVPGWLDYYLRLTSMTVLDVSPLVIASTFPLTKITAVVSSSVQNPSAFLCDDL